MDGRRRRGAGRTGLGIVALGLIALTLGPNAGAQPREITTADRLAILYSPQLNFTRDGEPLIHVGVLHGVRKISFTSTANVRALPLGDGGPEVILDGKKRTTVTIDDGTPGEYRYWVVVEKLEYSAVSHLDPTIDKWVERGYLPKSHEVGGLFAVGGRRIDSRVILIGVGGLNKRVDAETLAESVESRYGIDAQIHSELVGHPKGQLTVTGGGLPQTLTHRDVLWIAPTKRNQTFSVKAGKRNLKFVGSLVFTADRTGLLRIINAVPAETLVKGVVPSEIYTSAPLESLKAQAVAARSEILSYVGARHLADPFSICSDTHCQAYKGVDQEHPRTNRAVNQTRGQVMIESAEGSDLRLADTRYSSNCGGHSEHNDNVWGDTPHPYLRGNPDTVGALTSPFDKGIDDGNIGEWVSTAPKAWCNTTEFGGERTYRWTVTVSRKTLEKNLARYRDIGRVQEVEILGRGVSGRVTAMRLLGTKDELTLPRELAIRRAFGGLRSSMFTLEIDRNKKGLPVRFHIRGGGFGHGVGMCQTGAMMMGKAGQTYTAILRHYYRGAAVEKLY
jgi:SpoIID/LytB domain protein